MTHTNNSPSFPLSLSAHAKQEVRMQTDERTLPVFSPTDKVASGALILHRQLQQDLSAFACPFNHHCLSAFPNQLPRLREHPIDHVIVMTGIVMEKQNPFHIRIERKRYHAA
jgi:hypothetical protein